MNLRFSLICAVALVWTPTFLSLAGTFPDFGYEPPEGWMGRLFELSQDYPTALPQEESVPWKAIDFRTNPRGYMQAVIDYCYAGNLEVQFVGQDNATRKWYHAPWLHTGNNGREFVRGLTQERPSRPFELAPNQDVQYRNFAVGFYNPRGAYTIGKVWQDPDNPNSSNVSFAEDTVSFKLLFTTAVKAKVPFIEGSPEWEADINRSSDPAEIEQTKVRLLQVDIAVRDSRSACAAWVFGTFHYDKDVAAADSWKKLRPLSLMWGNDPALKQSDYDAGQRPTESWINQESPVVIYRSNPPAGVNPPRVLGWAGRANGPVDNPISSCLSCHSTAQIPASSRITPGNNLSETQKLRWFRNLAVGEAFDAASKTLDFSLQLGVGIRNHQDFHDLVDNLGGFKAAAVRAAAAPAKEDGQRLPRQYRFSRDPDE